MRTTGKIVAVIGGGLLFAGAGSAAGPPVVAATGGAARPIPAASTATRTVAYAGYEITVPADWPVYRLDTHPAQCVRYDIHAVYLGAPGTDQQCPAGLIGRTETVSILATPPGTGSVGTAPGGAAPAGAMGARQSLALRGGIRGQVRADTAAHEISVAVGVPVAGGARTRARPPAVPAGASVVATYGTDPALIQQVLGTLRPAPAGTPATTAAPGPAALAVPARQPSPAQDGTRASRIAAMAAQAIGAREIGQRAAAGHAAGRRESGPSPATTQPTTARWPGLPASWPTVIVEPAPATPAPRPLPGFDTCTAPSLPTMKAWRPGFAVVGIYIGGVNAACDYGNLSASWIRSAAAMGWSMLPTYVGPQAPCTSFRNLIMPSRAAAEGGAVADDAVRDAIALGLPKGSPIYYDMEAYADGSGCTAAVLTFLGAWTRQLTVRGYVSGVYSSRDSGIADVQAAAVARRAGFTPPQALWTALWDRRATLGAGTAPWPLTSRNKQYIGPHDMTIGGHTLNIDTDLAGGPVFSGG
jgi:Domain of unknown function (DUF1906)